MGNIMRHGTEWRQSEWIICKGMDTPLLLGTDTWNFLMSIDTNPWNDYCQNSGAHLSFLDIGRNGEAPPECCRKCIEEKKEHRDNRNLKGEAQGPGKQPESAKSLKQTLIDKGVEMAKKNSTAIVTLEADMPQGWKTRAYTKRRHEGKDP